MQTFRNSHDQNNITFPTLLIDNKPFPSSLVPLFQNQSKCETFHMKMSSACSFIFMQIKVIFALGLALKQRYAYEGTWRFKGYVLSDQAS